MSRQLNFLFMILIVLFLTLFYVMAKNAKKDYNESVVELAHFEEEAKGVSSLKKRFSKEQNERVIRSLLQIAPASKDYKKSNSRVILFENLSASSLASLLRRIENSTLRVRDLSITRVSKDSASLKLEIAK